nr:hypothetical protein B0A51_00928 [Rachicladosporium sp. CCFEE 5018]
MKVAEGPVVVTKWAKEHDISYQVLNNRFRGKSGPLHARKPPHLRLTTAQELALVQYAEQRDAIVLGLPLKVLSTMANQMLWDALPQIQQIDGSFVGAAD